jgi:hypothetical protein
VLDGVRVRRVLQLRRRIRKPAAVQHPVERSVLGVPVEAVPEKPLHLGDGHALDRDRHHDAGEARLGLAHLERVHRLARRSELRGEVGQSGVQACLRRIATEAGAQLRVDQKPFDQLRDQLVLLFLGACHQMPSG